MAYFSKNYEKILLDFGFKLIKNEPSGYVSGIMISLKEMQGDYSLEKNKPFIIFTKKKPVYLNKDIKLRNIEYKI